MPKLNEYGQVTPADADSVIGIDASDLTQSQDGSTKRFTMQAVRLWLASFFASTAQGAKADTALQARPTLALTVTSNTTLNRADIVGKRVILTIGTTVGTNRVLTIGDAGSWGVNDDVVFEVAASSGGAVRLAGSGANAILTAAASHYLWAAGSSTTLRRAADNSGFIFAQSLPIYAQNSNNYHLIYSTGAFKLVGTEVSEFNVDASGVFAQAINSGAAGTIARSRLFIDSQIEVANVTGTYALASQAETFSQQRSFGSEWLVKLGLSVAPHYNTTGLISGLPSGVVGKRHAAIRLTGARYTDSKHWGGIAIGAESGALYNGSWAFFSEWGGYYTQRAGGTVSEQRSTATSGTVTATEYTASLALAGSGDVTVTFPQTPEDGQEWTVFTETGYTSITLSAGAAGATILAATLGTSAGSFAEWRYRSASNIWRRIG